MTLKPWRELITPHKDVLDGTFKQSEFAADLTQVVNGSAPEEYLNAEKFFRRTFITEGMRLLLTSVVQRISGQGGDPVVQLQTSFGGGKTHALLAVYHLAKRQIDPEKLQGIPTILDKASVTEFPKGKVAVIDGNNISPSKPKKRGNITVNTIWGEIAWQLLGEPGYEIVSASDAEGTSPGKELLIELLKKASPSVILLDELVAFVRQLEPGKSYIAGTFESNMSFIQALTEAMKAVPNSLLLVSLPESEIEVAGPLGKLALESLEKYFARVESVWKPVATEEAFEIVKRRLFENLGDRAEIERVCKAYFDFYIDNNNKFPAETQSSRYHERLIQSYPIHPEVFDRLYSDWSTLEKFQRTRGVLQYLAIVIHRLWNSDNRDPMLMPGSVPLEDVTVRTKSIHYLPQGWEPVIESEIDGPRSQAFDVDGKEPRFGSYQAARRVARTVFLGSAPATGSQGSKGLPLDHVLLGSAQPGQIVAVYEDALKRLRDRLQYMFGDENRVWFDTRPNLRREMESRKQRLNYGEQVIPCIKEFVSKELKGSSSFSGVHIFTPSVDIPDESAGGPRLIVLEPKTDCAYSRANAQNTYDACLSILEKRGEQPRQKRNRLIFLAPDYDSLSRLRETAKTFLAWKSINSDIKDQKLNLDMYNVRQAENALSDIQKVLSHCVRDCFKWIVNPFEEMSNGKPNTKWEMVSVNSSGASYLSAIEHKLREEEWLIYEWSPIHLNNILNQWYFKNSNNEVITKKLYNDFSCYLYLPRLASESVLKEAIAQGIMGDDFFAYAQGKDGERFVGLVIGGASNVVIDESSLLVEKEIALKQRRVDLEKKVREFGEERKEVNSSPIEDEFSSTTDQTTASDFNSEKNYFFATKNLDVRKAKIEFNDIIESIVRQLSLSPSASIGVTLEVTAFDENSFKDTLREDLRKKCDELGLTFDFSRRTE